MVDEGTYACQAQILNGGLSPSRLPKNRHWNQTGHKFSSVHSAMLFVRSKEAKLTVYCRLILTIHNFIILQRVVNSNKKQINSEIKNYIAPEKFKG